MKRQAYNKTNNLFLADKIFKILSVYQSISMALIDTVWTGNNPMCIANGKTNSLAAIVNAHNASLR